ncbi:Palmitoyltransferase [Caenorhabditis elegans]|uniref:Palmitoyltransferase n=1 Tax=Caenorhabditis elegans TaxID=6239 RepID=G5EFD8_CAEEL|nr:Palmitoyltransferase [Caenorhabditis elegans]CAA92831.2 Palmitoyltransferase [Caenorhabditis elegans]|eukprot:NP_502302.2 Palmitoyltransferase [Caenorhabditis elegans]
MTGEVVETPDWPAPIAEIGDKPVFRRMFHFGTIFAFSTITMIGAVTTFFALQWMPVTSYMGLFNTLTFLLWNYLTIGNLFNASFFGPGYVPRGWRPENAADEKKLQFCVPCNGFKVPRSHHCSKCDRCCMKMDHHCPWINNCVGHRNHQYFLRFLFFSVVGCIHSTIIDGSALYHAIFAGWYQKYGDGTEPIILLTPISFIALVFAIAMAIAVALALTFLFITQLRYVIRNRNGIEDYIHGKSLNMRKVHEGDDEEEIEWIKSLGEWTYPYDLGWKRNLREVFIGIFDGRTRGNGTWWPVVNGCTQFTFTIDQLLQKQSKRGRSRIITISEDFAGTCCASRKFGCKVWMKQPIIDGKCLKVSAGETIVATRGIAGWVYGFRESDPRNKGWFPLEISNMKKKNDTKPDETSTSEDETSQDTATTEEEEKKNQ